MLRRFITLLLLLILALTHLVAYAIQGHIHVVANRARLPVPHYVFRLPMVLTLEFFSLNRTFTLNRLRVGEAVELAFIVTPNIYLQLIGQYLHDNSYAASMLTGIQRSHGIVRPYAEVSVGKAFPNNLPNTSELNYDIGFNFVFNHFFVPTIEFDNFLQGRDFALTPQLNFALTRVFSVTLEYSYVLHTGSNVGEIKLNYSF